MRRRKPKTAPRSSRPTRSGAISGLNVNFTSVARADLLAIRDWIAEHDERAAERVLSRIRQTAMMLGQFPMMGRSGQVAGTREFSVTGLPYLVVYQIVTATDLDILTVLHTSRKFPPEARSRG